MRRPLLFVHDPSFGGMGLGSEFLLEACSAARIATHSIELTTPGRSESRQGRLNTDSLRHATELYTRFVWLLLTRRVSRVYIPIAQWGLPLARDLALVATASLFRVPVVLHLHGSQLAERVSRPRHTRDTLIRRLLQPKTWAVLSPQLRELLLASGAASTVRVLRNPAYPAPAHTQGMAEGRLRVGFLGLCCSEKGLDILLTAIERLRVDRAVDATLTIGGPEGDVAPPTAGWVCYLGKVPREQLEESFWPNVDLVALPARWHEGLPFAVLEALQHGKVVFANSSPGLGELVEAGAISAVPADADSYTFALAEAAQDLSSLQTAQQKAWTALAPRFEPKRLMSEWLAGLGISH